MCPVCLCEVCPPGYVACVGVCIRASVGFCECVSITHKFLAIQTLICVLGAVSWHLGGPRVVGLFAPIATAR